MIQNWVADVDLLAANGIIDYDGAAYIHGKPPRYVGNPAFRVVPPPMGVGMMQPPLTQDTFNPADKPLIENPGWKKLLFTFLAGGLLMYGGIKFKGSKPMKWMGKQLTNCWDWIKKPFTKKP